MFGAYGFGQGYFGQGPLGNIEIIAAVADVIVVPWADVRIVVPAADVVWLLVPEDEEEVTPR